MNLGDENHRCEDTVAVSLKGNRVGQDSCLAETLERRRVPALPGIFLEH
jgi:hypothetical protein